MLKAHNGHLEVVLMTIFHAKRGLGLANCFHLILLICRRELAQRIASDRSDKTVLFETQERVYRLGGGVRITGRKSLNASATKLVVMTGTVWHTELASSTSEIFCLELDAKKKSTAIPSNWNDITKMSLDMPRP